VLDTHISSSNKIEKTGKERNMSQVGEGVENYVKCFVTEAVRKRLLGRHKRRWDHNTKIILKETERKELIWLLIRNNSMVREKS
jgi:hypothetical protein